MFGLAPTSSALPSVQLSLYQMKLQQARQQVAQAQSEVQQLEAQTQQARNRADRANDRVNNLQRQSPVSAGPAKPDIPPKMPTQDEDSTHTTLVPIKTTPSANALGQTTGRVIDVRA